MSDKPFRFTEADCDYVHEVASHSTGQVVLREKLLTVDRANALLDSYLAGLPVVYGQYDRDFGVFHYMTTDEPEKHDTHTARLWSVEKIGEGK